MAPTSTINARRLCPPSSAKLVHAVCNSELVVSFPLLCFPWFLLPTMTVYVSRVNIHHNLHFYCPIKSCTVLFFWGGKGWVLPLYMGLCPDVQTNKIIFTHMYMTGITLQTWGGGKGWTVESRGDGEEGAFWWAGRSPGLQKSSLIVVGLSFGVACVGWRLGEQRMSGKLYEWW
jgi:hypothetical protein